MIYLLCPDEHAYAGNLVKSALARSFSQKQVEKIDFQLFNDNFEEKVLSENVYVIISPPEDWSEFIEKLISKEKVKILFFGALSPSLSCNLGVTLAPIPEQLHLFAETESTPAYDSRESLLRVRYLQTLGSIVSPIMDRPFVRFDFSNEWNNRGFGAIRLDGSPWSIQQIVFLRSPIAKLLADVVLGEDAVSAYSACWDFENSSLLWFNRLVGPIDSHEWRLIEEFVSSYRFRQIPCLPVLIEVPFGYSGAVTMRLDCDEEISSSRFLFKLYKDRGIPFSLAVHTALLEESSHHKFLVELLNSGGAILSHSATHPKNWGGSYEEAYFEAKKSKETLLEATGEVIRYAVSPFHQTPAYALKALYDAGYSGCIGGIISSDPEFLLARGGEVLDSEIGFIGHSQQCMFHGDCLLKGPDPLIIYKKAFEHSFNGRALFGFLDHPFSERYQYGWKNEKTRIDIHNLFLNYIAKRRKVIFLNESQAMDFLFVKGRISISNTPRGFRFNTSALKESITPLVVAAELGGTLYPIYDGMEITC